MATLAAILVVVAYNMSEWRSFLEIFKSPKSDIAVLLTTFGLTVVFDLNHCNSSWNGVSRFSYLCVQWQMVTNVGIITRELKDDDEESMIQMQYNLKKYPMM